MSNKPMSKKCMMLGIYQCPEHPHYWAIVVGQKDGGGTRITQGKCCGQLRAVREWSMTAEQWRSAARIFHQAAETMKPLVSPSTIAEIRAIGEKARKLAERPTSSRGRYREGGSQ